MMKMSPEEFRRAASMWGIAMCLLVSAAGWVFMRFGQAWSVADLPVSDFVEQIVPAYVITEVAFIPVGGKLVDRYGCRSVLAIAPFVYIVSSMLCMVTPSVELLIMFRLLQGAGAGMILALAFSCVGKFYDLDKRGKCNELMTAAFAIGSLFGSSMGYFFTEKVNWRFGFIVFSAVMLVGFIIAWRFLPKEEVQGEGRLDIPGLLITALAFAVVTLYTQMVNILFDLISVQSLLFLIVSLTLIGLAIYRSYHSDSPVTPIRTTRFEKTMIFLMFIFSLCGLGLIQYFFKLYLTYYDFDIYKATLMFVFMLAGGAATSMPGVRFVYRTGSKPWIVAGSAIVTVALMFTHLYADKGIPWLALSLFLFGLGLGCIVTEIICSMQTIVPKKDMGVHTANLMAIRMVAIMAGNVLIGTYINNVIRSNRAPAVIDLSVTDNALVAIRDYLSTTLQYLSDSMDSGFLMTAIILAMVTAGLTAVAYLVGRDDIKILNAMREKEKEQ